MNLISQMLRSFILLSALLLTVISLSANWLFERGSLNDWLNDCVILLEAHHKADQLVRESEISLNRVCVKANIAKALTEGEMKLIDAAALFRSLHEDPKSWHDPNRPLPDPKDAEAWCREVIEWTERYMQPGQSHKESRELHQRLAMELRGLQNRVNAPLRE